MLGFKSNFDVVPPKPEESPRRCNAEALEGYVVKRMGSRKRVGATPIDFCRQGVGLKMEIPLLEQGDEVMVYLSAAKDSSVVLNGMPGIVRYRMGWRNGFRVGIEFNPHRKMVFSRRLREEAERIEAYLRAPCPAPGKVVIEDEEEIDLADIAIAMNGAP